MSSSKVDIDIPAAEPVILMSRMFDAPREKLWECFTRPEHVVRWFGGAGFGNEVLAMDVRTGGIWRHVMILPDGQRLPQEFVYVEVKKPERLVWQNSDHGKRTGPPPTCRQTITLEDHGEKTLWRLHASFSSMADRDFAKSMGFAETISQGTNKFAAVLKEI